MLLIKFEKTNLFTYNSYLNCRDVIVQTLKRANIKVSYSQGFNPHELIFFSPPTSLGIESYCEYMYIITDYNLVDEFKTLFNKYAPMGIKVDKVRAIEKKPNFYDLIDYADYQIVTNSTLSKNVIEAILNTVEFKDKIYSIAFEKNTIKCVLACGQKSNLKLSKMVDILKELNIITNRITKLNLYKMDNGNLINIDDILF